MAANKINVADLSPDGYSRFFVLIDILKDLYGKAKKPVRILDVGGGSEYMEQQLQAVGLQYDLTIIDIIARPSRIKAIYIQGDATKMEFEDDSFDVVISTDVLEHVPNDRKQAFLNECLRVAKDACIIAAPFETEGVNDAEVVVNEFNKKLFGVGQSWLEEHLEYGKPTRELFIKTLSKQKIPYLEFGTQHLTTWLLNTQLNLIDAKLGLDKRRHIEVNRFYNQNLMHMNEFIGPTYRHFFVMFKDSNKQTSVRAEKYLSSPVDSQLVAEYSNKLMTLLSDRIGQLSKQARKLEHEAHTLRQDVVELRAANQHMRVRLAKYERVLRYLRPLKKVARKSSRGTLSHSKKVGE